MKTNFQSYKKVFMQKIRYFLMIFILCLIPIFSNSFAQETENQIKLSLEDCISLALKSNLNVNAQRINPEIQDSLLKIAEGYFDPSISFGPNVSKSNDPSSGTNSRNGNTFGLALGFSDPISTGGDYGISFNSNRFKSTSNTTFLNPSYSSGLTFSVTQPLLKNFGVKVNKSYIYIAKNNKDISLLRLKSQLINTLSDVQNTYWELIFAQENLKVQQLALKQAQDLLILNQRFKDSGKATISDVLQAQSAVASREADVISAMDLVKESEERLKRITNIIQDEKKWDLPIMLVDVPSFEEININLQESIDVAMKNRPEYLQAQLDIQNSDISIKLAKNQRLPTLDLEGSVSLNGFAGESGESLSQVGKADYDSWSAALALRMPLGTKVTKANERKSQLEKQQKLLILKDTEQQIVAEVHSNARLIDTNKKRIDATTAAEQFAMQVLATEEKRYSVGLSTSYQLLQFQANQTIATKNHLRSVIDYRESIVNLYQSLGITLEKLNIKLEEERR
jgi:outer membrane protein TolC